jgi:holo-[acyl-carrier protein] synthase
MIVGLGVDLVECSRFESELARGEWQAADGVFTQDELAYCNGAQRRQRRFAACFAAKEAALKALGTDVEDLGIFREIEIKFASGFAGDILLRGRLQAKAEELGVHQITLSVTARRKVAAAMVILQS